MNNVVQETLWDLKLDRINCVISNEHQPGSDVVPTLNVTLSANEDVESVLFFYPQYLRKLEAKSKFKLNWEFNKSTGRYVTTIRIPLNSHLNFLRENSYGLLLTLQQDAYLRVAHRTEQREVCIPLADLKIPVAPCINKTYPKPTKIFPVIHETIFTNLFTIDIEDEKTLQNYFLQMYMGDKVIPCYCVSEENLRRSSYLTPIITDVSSEEYKWLKTVRGRMFLCIDVPKDLQQAFAQLQDAITIQCTDEMGHLLASFSVAKTSKKGNMRYVPSLLSSLVFYGADLLRNGSRDECENLLDVKSSGTPVALLKQAIRIKGSSNIKVRLPCTAYITTDTDQEFTLPFYAAFGHVTLPTTEFSVITDHDLARSMIHVHCNYNNLECILRIEGLDLLLESRAPLYSGFSITEGHLKGDVAYGGFCDIPIDKEEYKLAKKFVNTTHMGVVDSLIKVEYLRIKNKILFLGIPEGGEVKDIVLYWDGAIRSCTIPVMHYSEGIPCIDTNFATSAAIALRIKEDGSGEGEFVIRFKDGSISESVKYLHSNSLQSRISKVRFTKDKNNNIFIDKESCRENDVIFKCMTFKRQVNKIYKMECIIQGVVYILGITTMFVTDNSGVLYINEIFNTEE